tara:strand:+ start:2916 stop:4175 length:1260 start_codon:yes stop_codon:yes gene_type:complete
MRLEKNIFENVDWWLILMYVLLVLIGWINIYAALYQEGFELFDFSQKYGKQLQWIIISSGIAIVILFFNWQFFEGFAYIIYFIVILTLIGVLFFGIEVNGAKSWYDLGFLRIQPAEFAKFSTCIAVAKYLSTLHINIKDLRTKLIAGAIVLLPALLIIFQNDTGSALVYTAFLIVLYRAGLPGTILILGISAALLFVSAILVPKTYLLISLAVLSAIFFFFSRKRLKEVIVITTVFIMSVSFSFSVDYVLDNVLEAHHVTRIKILLGQESDPHGDGYNVHQSMIAIGSGGFSGKGFLEGTQTKFNFVPEQSTDFIFCTIGEEWGFLGSAFIVVLYIVFLLRIIFVAERQRSVFSKIYGYGVASILFFHVAINIAMTIGLAPVIGIPLPFISYGGSSLWAFTILLFIFINLDSYRLQVLR